MELLGRFLCNFIPSKYWRHWGRRLVKFGPVKYIQWARRERKRSFKHYLAAAAIVRNEGPYLAEWLEYHHLVGIEKFYIYDNQSTDNTAEVLRPYVQAGWVEYIPFPGEKRQLPAYQDALTRSRETCRWLALFDLDEFLVPVQDETLADFVRNLTHNSPHIHQIVVTWKFFGSAGLRNKPAGLVIENFQRCAADDFAGRCTKCIINPRAVYAAEVHHCDVWGHSIDENGHKSAADGQPTSYRRIRVNHYAVKSHEEFVQKALRGDAYFGAARIRSEQYFADCDRNENFDPLMNRFVPAVKKALAARKNQQA